MMPVTEALLPLAVRNIDFINMIAFVEIGVILNALVTKNIHENPIMKMTRFLNILFVREVLWDCILIKVSGKYYYGEQLVVQSSTRNQS